jgi:hypothetical protein
MPGVAMTGVVRAIGAMALARTPYRSSSRAALTTWMASPALTAE